MTTARAPRLIPFTLASARFQRTHSYLDPKRHRRGLAITGAVAATLATVLLKHPRSWPLSATLLTPAAGLLAYQGKQAVADKSAEREHLLEQVARLQRWALHHYGIVILTDDAITLLAGVLKPKLPAVQVFKADRSRGALQLCPTHGASTFEFLLADEAGFLPQEKSASL